MGQIRQKKYCENCKDNFAEVHMDDADGQVDMYVCHHCKWYAPEGWKEIPWPTRNPGYHFPIDLRTPEERFRDDDHEAEEEAKEAAWEDWTRYERHIDNEKEDD